MALQKQDIIKQNNSVVVHRQGAFDIGYKQYFKNLTKNKISEVLNNKDRNIKFETITYRQLNSWEEQGLLTNDREDRSWRRFSIMDALWVRIIQELREFGLGWEQIKNTKYSLDFDSATYGVAMPILEFYTAFAIGSKMPVLLMVFKDGVGVPANFTQYKVASEFGEVENHLQINLNKILQGFFPNVDLQPIENKNLPMDLTEMELLAFIRVGEYEKVEIKLSGNKIKLIEGTKREIGEKVFEVLKSKTYEEIIVRKDKEGNITSLLRKKKLKFED